MPNGDDGGQSLVFLATVDFTDFDGKIAKAKREAEAQTRKIEKARKRLEDIRKRADATRLQILKLGTEARRLQVLTAKQGTAFSGFGSTGFKSMVTGASGAIFSLGSATIFEKVLGESSPFSSVLAVGLAGLATGNPLAAAVGMVAASIGGLIGEAQRIQQKIDEVERRIKEEMKVRKQREQEFAKRLEEEARQNNVRLFNLERKLRDISEDRRISTLRLLAAGA